MKIGLLCLCISLILPISLSADVNKGKFLYDEEKCSKCHSHDIFTHEDRKVKNYKRLKKQVKWCAFQNDAPWFDDETDYVIHYLNHYFYKYPKED